MVVLKDVMRPDMYAMFIDLVVSMKILNDEDGVHREKMVNYAESLLRHFVSSSGSMLGEHFIVYNVHGLIHLAGDVRRFKKPLRAMDAFPFENHLQVIKNK